MNYLIIKYCLTAAIVVLASELTKSDERLGGLVAAFPLVTILTLVWLYIENQPISKISSQAYYTFWYVIPTLPMFLVFTYLLPKLGFWMSLLSSIGFTLVIFYFYALILKQFGIHLF